MSPYSSIIRGNWYFNMRVCESMVRYQPLAMRLSLMRACTVAIFVSSEPHHPGEQFCYWNRSVIWPVLHSRKWDSLFYSLPTLHSYPSFYLEFPSNIIIPGKMKNIFDRFSGYVSHCAPLSMLQRMLRTGEVSSFSPNKCVQSSISIKIRSYLNFGGNICRNDNINCKYGQSGWFR